MLKRPILLIAIIGLLLSTAITQAQQRPNVLTVLQDSAGGIAVYSENLNANITLLRPEQVPPGGEVAAQIAPSGDLIAVTVREVGLAGFPLDAEGQTLGDLGINNYLYVFRMTPDAELIHERALLQDDFVIQFGHSTDTFGYLHDTILRADSLIEWSPDSTRLIYVQGDATHAEEFEPNGYGTLAVYTVADDSVFVIPPERGTPFNLEWSPDGTYLLFSRSRNFGTGAGPSADGTFVYGLEDGVIRVPLDEITVRPNVPVIRFPEVYGWQDDQKVVFSLFSIIAGGAGLYSYDVVNDDMVTILPAAMDSIDPRASGFGSADDGGFVLTATEFVMQEIIEEEPELEILSPGTYYFPSLDADPILVHQGMSDRAARSAGLASNDVLVYVLGREGETFAYDVNTGETATLANTDRFALISNNKIFYSDRDVGAAYMVDVVTGQTDIVTGAVPDSQMLRWVNDTAYIVVLETVVYLGLSSGELFEIINMEEPGGIVLDAALDVLSDA